VFQKVQVTMLIPSSLKYYINKNHYFCH